jgi:integrase
MRFAVDEGFRADDPSAGLKKLKIRGGGFAAWSEDDISRFEARFEVGTRARLALALLLYTAQRRSDVIRMGWQHVREGNIAVTQQKTSASLWIPIHPVLSTILAATPRQNMTFLVTARGKPFTPAGFGNWFGESCRRAGLPVGHNAHGLRKSAARRLAEAGCTSRQIMAVTGHRSLDEVERYTREATRAISMLKAKTETSTG